MNMGASLNMGNKCRICHTIPAYFSPVIHMNFNIISVKDISSTLGFLSVLILVRISDFSCRMNIWSALSGLAMTLA